MLNQIFKAYDIRATYPDKLNEDAAWKVGYASATWLKQNNQNQVGDILVSRDMRPSSPSLCQALIEGIRQAGMNVVDLGMCDTSFIYFAINHLNAIGGIQTTASHNPVHYNGFKISSKQAKPVGATTGLKEIQALAENIQGRPASEKPGSYQQADLWQAYRQHVLSFLHLGQRPIRVFVDASNGMAGKMVPIVFKNIKGLDIIPINFETDGHFAHQPNPLVAENMIPTQQGVQAHHADMGACFDGDADRCMITDELGQTIACDHLTALLTKPFLEEEPNASIIYDLRSSKVVEETILAHGGKPHQGRVGHVFMKALLRETQGIFGGELSGHFYFKKNFYADSGAIAFAAVCSLLSHTDQPLSKLVAPFKKYPQSGEINFHCPDKEAVLAQIQKTWSHATIQHLDGITISDWEQSGYWLNVRASNTEPLLRLNAEAKNQSTLDHLLAKIKPMLGTEETAGH